MHNVTTVIYRNLWIEDRENRRGCQRNMWLLWETEGALTT